MLKNRLDIKDSGAKGVPKSTKMDAGVFQNGAKGVPKSTKMVAGVIQKLSWKQVCKKEAA